MVAKVYEWEDGAELDEHSKRKHKVLREYFSDYLRIRCQNPNQERFRMAIVDGFCGAGKYRCGAPGSPLIFLETLYAVSNSLNIERAAQGLRAIQIDVLLILNDATPGVVDLCKENIAGQLGEIREQADKLNIEVFYLSQEFEVAYPSIKATIENRGYKNSVFFNLDQCGHSLVELDTISDILTSFAAPEIILTFMIQALLTYLPKTDQDALQRRLERFGVSVPSIDNVEECMTNQAWLGAAERTVYNAMSRFGVYVSPFSINNPTGWRYWLIHFAKKTRARQVYNNILHRNSSAQAHFGRAGLDMLHYDPNEDATLYLFKDEDRKRATEQLYDDIPRRLANSGDAIQVEDFYQDIYNHTPAHSDDIHQAIIKSPDLTVITPNGGERRVANTIHPGDTLKLKPQRSFFSILFPNGKADKE
ncbi:three-Cys-motif partner protein TcmP [Hyphomonas atlantica]|uniref:GMT-like wHTH domain-containing protein n=1 Tax=Hyphomonas atlantica TaxID=1280948 RepID=A0A059E0I7_9PROT|nr:three-Cys-motif partner protein TcmP [Hyphomonas atlantica]KCZ61434.1 hypothetical protein HY36_16830 [Hyphomonas atlantica]